MASSPSAKASEIEATRPSVSDSRRGGARRIWGRNGMGGGHGGFLAAIRSQCGSVHSVQDVYTAGTGDGLSGMRI